MSDQSQTVPPSHRGRTILIITAIVVVVAAVAVTVVLVVRSGLHSAKSTCPIRTRKLCHVSPQTPAFSFKLVSSVAIPGSKDASGLTQVAAQEGAQIQFTLSRMYQLAFLDPANWKNGQYQDVVGFFDMGAPTATAQRDESLLTLGAGAGAKFDKVLPRGGTLRVRLLLDQGGHPALAVADATFQAVATEKSGARQLVVSTGQFFMHIEEGGWMIAAFSTNRADRPLAPAPTPAPTNSTPTTVGSSP